MHITLLTKPLAPLARAGLELERRFNLYKYRLKGNSYKIWTNSFSEGGHQDVVGSFLRGAGICGVPVSVNPSANAISSVVYVPSSWRALKDALKLKRRGSIVKLAAGPTVCDVPTMHNRILSDPDIDYCIVASDWVKRFYLSICPELTSKIRVWPAGVDTKLWTPVNVPNALAHHLLVYVKNSGAQVEGATLSLLSAHGFLCEVLRCGSHVPDDYRSALNRSDAVVVLGESESQGLSLYQAWSMDRRTFVLDSGIASRYFCRDGCDATPFVSPAPYLTEQTGRLWHNGNELIQELKKPMSLSPRQWVLLEGTDEIAFRRFAEVLGEES